MWSKFITKIRSQRVWDDLLAVDLQQKSTLACLDFDPHGSLDHLYNSNTQKWWFLARIEGYFLRHRKEMGKLCPSCKLMDESNKHFLMDCPIMKPPFLHGMTLTTEDEEKSDSLDYWLSNTITCLFVK